jgi:SAM-dependent methyltransferase
MEAGRQMKIHEWLDQNAPTLDPHLFERFEAMQALHIPLRARQFDLVKQIVLENAQRIGVANPRILDLGCGPGELLAGILDGHAGAEGIGMDADPLLLAIGRRQHSRFGSRINWEERDFREFDFAPLGPFHAVISSTTFHWLGRASHVSLYQCICNALAPGGVLVVRDPLAGEFPWRQDQIWRIDADQKSAASSTAENWDEFWENLYAAHPGLKTLHEEVKESAGLWEGEGTDDGQPWTFHEEAFKAAGFANAEIFFRDGRGAVFGAFRPASPGSA